MRSALNVKAGIKTAHLRWLFLGPVMVVITIMMWSLIAAVYLHAEEDITRHVQMLRTSAAEIYDDNQEHLTGMLDEAATRQKKIGIRVKLL